MKMASVGHNSEVSKTVSEYYNLCSVFQKSVAEKIKETERPPTPSDLIDAMKTHFEGKLSSIEWDELKISEDDFCTSSDSSLAASTYLKLVCPKWKKMMKTMEDETGAPLLLIICPAAIRAVQLNRLVLYFEQIIFLFTN